MSQFMSDGDQGAVFAFSGGRGALARLVFRNLLLTVITLGIYSFWARTNVRAFFWRHISLSGEHFDYIGRGMELLLGAMIAFILLVILFAAQNIWDFWRLSQQDFSAVMQFFLYSFSLIIFLSLVAAGRFLSWRYLATRTLWRAVRFHMGGRVLRLLPEYIAISLVLLLANLTTLGLTYPYWRAWRMGYLINHSFFGSLKLEFSGDAKMLMNFWWPVWICMAGFLVFLVGALSFLAQEAALMMFGMAFILFASLVYFFLKYKGEEIKFFLNHIHCQNIRVRSSFPPEEFAGRLFGNIALVIIFCLLTLPFIFILFPILWRVFVILPAFSYVCDHSRVENYQQLENALASGEMASFIGEGLAGGLDADFGI